MSEHVHILVIEDDLVDRMYITRALKDAGLAAQIVFTDNINDTLREIKLRKFDLIITDYSLPGTTGLFILESIKNSGCKSPVIMVTSQGDERLAVEAMKAGATDYLPKSLVTGEGLAQSIRYIKKLQEAENSKKLIENNLRFTEDKLHKILSHSPVIISFLDAEGTVKAIQGKNVETFPVKEGDSILTSFENNVQLNQTFLNAKTGKEGSTTIQINNKYFEIHFSPVKYQDEKVNDIFVIAADISAYKQAEQELINNKKMIEEAAKMKEQFLANMSHEIRTPMHGIFGLTELLCKTKLTSEQKEYLNAIRDSTENLLVIINDILDISKIEAGKLIFESISFNVCNVIKSNLDLLRAKAEEKNLEINCDCSSEIPAMLKGDRVRLGQVLINLIGNAIKFTEKGKISIEVKLLKEEEKFVTLQFKVSDTGIGIPKDRLTSIFDSFTQASTDTTRKYGGTGLGLAIVKKLVELQDGSIEVESAAGVGTTFTFILSYLKEENVIEEIKIPESKSIDSDLKDLKILLVEDNPINTMIATKILTEWGIIVDEATNGQIGLSKIKQGNYDLILMDVQMPEMDGFETTGFIRNTLPSPASDTPILAMTAHANKLQREKCIKVGMNDYISKPFNPDDLKLKIVKLVNKPLRKKEPVADKKVNIHDNNSKINLDLLKMMSGDNNDFIKEFIGIFLTNTPQSVSNLVEAVEKNDWENIRQIAHKLKPTFTYIGLSELGSMSNRIEELAKKKTGMKEINQLTSRLNKDCKAAVLQLENELLTL